MDTKITTIKDVKKLRKALRLQYEKFTRDFNQWTEKFREIVKDADLMLSATETILDVKASK